MTVKPKPKKSVKFYTRCPFCEADTQKKVFEVTLDARQDLTAYCYNCKTRIFSQKGLARYCLAYPEYVMEEDWTREEIAEYLQEATI